MARAVTVFALFGLTALELTVGTLLVAISLRDEPLPPVRSLARLSTTFAKASASQRRVIEILESTENVPEDPSSLIARSSRLARPLVWMVRIRGYAVNHEAANHKSRHRRSGG